MRNAFWITAAELLKYRRALIFASMGAMLSAVCFGAGISLMLPLLKLFFDKQSIDAVAAGNAEAHPLRQVINTALLGGEGEAAAPWRVDLARQLSSYVPNDMFQSFLLVMGTIVVLSMIGSVGRYIHELLTITATQRWATDFRERLFRSMIHAPIGRLDVEEGSGFGGRIVIDTAVVSRGHLAILSKAAADILKGVVCFVFALVLDWKLTALSILVVVPIAVILKRFGKTIRRASKRALHEQSAMLQSMNEVFVGLPVLKVHNAEGYERRRFRGMNRRVFQQQMRMRQARALASPIVETLSLLAVILAASVAGYYIFRKGLDPAEFLVVLGFLAAAGASLRPVAAIQTQVKEAQGAAERLLEGVSLEAEPILPSIRRKLPSIARHRRDVVFENVSYHYRGREQAALDEVTLHVPFGASVAIVGPNGAGKSTLLSLLPRLIEPTRGRVLIDGVDIAGVNLRSLREGIAVVTQQTVLFEGTIADNIAYGRRHTDRDRIVAAAKAAHAHDFIMEHPDGYDRQLGEAGEGLSGGQKQRLAIARAILRDPAILILDEATSQIDSESERNIIDALREFRAGRTTFTIAHRLSTVVDADMIIVMVDGRIAATGKHHELQQTSPVYQTLTRTQLQPSPEPIGAV